MKKKAYKYLFTLALLLLGASGYSEQVIPAEPVQPEPLPHVYRTDSLSRTDFSKLRLKMEKLNQVNWHKQTLAMQKSYKKLQEKMEDFSNNISSEIVKSFNDEAPLADNEGYQDDEAQRVKTYSKTYPANADDELSLNNAYGRITVNTWAKNEVKVDVQIKAYASNDNAAQNTLGTVTINDSKDGNTISFKTNINNQHSSFWSWGNNNHHKVEVNYIVFMPARLQLSVSNSYGNIILPDLNGQTKIRTAYGNITAQRLSNPSTEISTSYGNIKVGYFNGGKINVAYGDISLSETNNLRASISYGKVVNLGKISGDIHLNLAYLDNLRITNIDDELKVLKINSAYSDVSISPTLRSNFSFDVVATYGNFNFDDSKVNITRRTPEPGQRSYGPTKTYRGTYGKGNADAQVTINSTYGNVKID